MTIAKTFQGWPAQHYADRQTASHAALENLRRKAWNRFTQRGFPTLKDERWRFTDISAVVEGKWQRAAGFDTGAVWPADVPSADPSAWQLLFINGRFIREGSRLPGADAPLAFQLFSQPGNGLLESALGRLTETVAATEEPFALINAALAEEGIVLSIPDGVTLAAPIQLLFYTHAPAAVATHPRLLLLMGERAQAELVEIYSGSGEAPCFTNPVVDVVVGAESRLDHYALQCERAEAMHLSYTRATLGRSSRYTRYALDFGSGLARHDLVAELDGEGAEAELNGLYLPTARQHIDHHTLLCHLQPRTFSRQLYKGVLQERAHAVFNGRIHVARAAQRTDAIQHNKNLLLSDAALADSQPQLEIFADDVRCTHGGTIGQLDQEGLFYLQSRGISAAKARQIMVNAFAGEIVDKIHNESVRAHVERLLAERLGGEG